MLIQYQLGVFLTDAREFSASRKKLAVDFPSKAVVAGLWCSDKLQFPFLSMQATSSVPRRLT
jgi:hypothetical protein